MAKKNKEPGFADLSILERFKQEEERIKKETAKVDREMKANLREAEENLATVQEKLAKEREALEKMKADYKSLLSEIEKKEKQCIERKEITLKDLEDGKVTSKEFFHRGIKPEKVSKLAREKAKEKLTDLLMAIRKKAKEVVELEIEEGEAKDAIYHCSTYPSQSMITRLKAHIQTLEQKISAVLEGYPQSRAVLDEKREELKLINGKSLSGWIWRGLSEQEVEELRFDPRIPEVHLDSLEEIIQQVKGTGKIITVRLDIERDGSEPGLTFWEEQQPITSQTIRS